MWRAFALSFLVLGAFVWISSATTRINESIGTHWVSVADMCGTIGNVSFVPKFCDTVNSRVFACVVGGAADPNYPCRRDEECPGGTCSVSGALCNENTDCETGTCSQTAACDTGTTSSLLEPYDPDNPQIASVAAGNGSMRQVLQFDHYEGVCTHSTDPNNLGLECLVDGDCAGADTCTTATDAEDDIAFRFPLPDDWGGQYLRLVLYGEAKDAPVIGTSQDLCMCMGATGISDTEDYTVQATLHDETLCVVIEVAGRCSSTTATRCDDDGDCPATETCEGEQNVNDLLFTNFDFTPGLFSASQLVQVELWRDTDASEADCSVDDFTSDLRVLGVQVLTEQP